MSNETDLDWLARNVHVWVPNELLRMKPCDNGNGTFRASWCYSGDGGFTKDQWLARRTELQSRPRFADHPNAKCFFQHESGRWFKNVESSDMGVDAIGWYNKQLSRRADCGWVDIGLGEVLGDWRDTLEKRPVQAEFKPFVSVEDAVTDKQPAITPSKYTKTIRGVTVDVYDVLQAWGVSNPALQHLIKKALQCGQRGHKDNAQDLQDIIDSAIRAKELG